MVLADIADALDAQERNLREFAATLITTTPDFDQGVVNAVLKEAETLVGVSRHLRVLHSGEEDDRLFLGAAKPGSLVDSLPADGSCNGTAAESLEFPLYFVDQDNIYKVGRSKTKSKGKNVWWKSVSIDEGLKLMAVIESFGLIPFKQSMILEIHKTPEYRVDIVLSALRKFQYIQPSSQRGYYTVCCGNPNEWMETIRMQPNMKHLIGPSC